MQVGNADTVEGGIVAIGGLGICDMRMWNISQAQLRIGYVTDRIKVYAGVAVPVCITGCSAVCAARHATVR